MDDAEDLELSMSMYNLTEYSSNYSETTGSFWFYSKEGAAYFNADIANNNSFRSFKYKAKLLGNTEADWENKILRNAAIAVPFKYLSNFYRSLEMPLINCKVELKNKWTKYCIFSAAGADNFNAKSNNIFSLSKTQNYMFLL